MLSDTDHYAPVGSDALWAWKSFLRGHNPLLYDLGIVSGVPPSDPSAGAPSYDSLEPARHALGDIRRVANSALARPGHDYLVLQPAGSDPPLTVDRDPGTYAARWFDVDHRDEREAEPVRVDQATTVTVRSPFDTATSAVVHLAANLA